MIKLRPRGRGTGNQNPPFSAVISLCRKGNQNMIKGANIAGGNGKYARTALDYYATPPEAAEKLLMVHQFKGKMILEPCVGGGHIANVLKKHFPESHMTCLDVADRGYPGTILSDFLTWGGVLQRV